MAFEFPVLDGEFPWAEDGFAAEDSAAALLDAPNVVSSPTGGARRSLAVIAERTRSRASCILTSGIYTVISRSFREASRSDTRASNNSFEPTPSSSGVGGCAVDSFAIGGFLLFVSRIKSAIDSPILSFMGDGVEEGVAVFGLVGVGLHSCR